MRGRGVIHFADLPCNRGEAELAQVIREVLAAPIPGPDPSAKPGPKGRRDPRVQIVNPFDTPKIGYHQNRRSPWLKRT